MLVLLIVGPLPNLMHFFPQFVLEVTAKCLPVFEQIFDIEYPLPKLDTAVCNLLLFVRIFANDAHDQIVHGNPGAMENWVRVATSPLPEFAEKAGTFIQGLITGGTSVLLFHPDKGSLAGKKMAAIVQIHEVR